MCEERNLGQKVISGAYGWKNGQHSRAQSCPLGRWHRPAGAQARVLATASVMNCCGLEQQQRYLLVILWVDYLGWSLLGSLVCSQLVAGRSRGSKTGLMNMPGGWYRLPPGGWSGNLSLDGSSLLRVASHPSGGQTQLLHLAVSGEPQVEESRSCKAY